MKAFVTKKAIHIVNLATEAAREKPNEISKFLDDMDEELEEILQARDPGARWLLRAARR
jgi:hypothetical protein